MELVSVSEGSTSTIQLILALRFYNVHVDNI